MRTRTLLAIGFASISLTAWSASAQQVQPRFSLEASVAQKMIAACEAFAKARGGAANIWVLNLLGQPVGFERMDGANPWMGDWAYMKAETAIKTGSASSSYMENFKRRGVTQGTGMAYQLEQFPRAGGVPVLVKDLPIGAIGVEGLGPQEDEKCAQAGIDAVKDVLPK